MRTFTASPHVLVFLGLSEAAAAAAFTAPALGQILGAAGFIVALLMALFAYRRDRRDREAERIRQLAQHDENRDAVRNLTSAVHGLLAKEERNARLRHDRPGEMQHILFRFAHHESWIARAAESAEFPLPPFDPLPPPTTPQRRHDDG